MDLKRTHETCKFVMMMITLTLNKHKKMNMITMMTLSKHMNMTMTIALNKHVKTNMTRSQKKNNQAMNKCNSFHFNFKPNFNFYIQ
jgi:hypothetical protein